VHDGDGRFRVHSDVYLDPAVYALEMQRVFGGTWVFVAHESMLPEPGDYLTGMLGAQPLIVSRGDDGRVHVLFNRCAHRGSVVCREERGRARTFRCPYHAWVYRNDGTLLAAAQKSGYPPDFADWGLRLMAVPHVESYRGLVFVNLAETCEPLLERLAGVRRYIDMWCDRSPGGRVELPLSTQRYTYPGNWKLQMENGVDGYHGNYVHESYAHILDRSGERKAGDIARTRNRLGSINYAKGLAAGDGVLERDDAMLGSYDTKSHTGYRDQLATLHGDVRADDILMQRNIFVFPNLYLFESHIRVIRPVSVDSTIVDVYPTVLAGVDEALNEARLAEHQRFYGPASFGAPDDIEIFVSAQSGVAVTAMPWMELSRGLQRETTNEAGEVCGHSTDEAPQRAMYRRWSALMAAEQSVAPA
jgi:benzoate/toluate 1,2-dioxygenase alpha subunit